MHRCWFFTYSANKSFTSNHITSLKFYEIIYSESTTEFIKIYLSNLLKYHLSMISDNATSTHTSAFTNKRISNLALIHNKQN